MTCDKKKRNLILGGIAALAVFFVIKSLFFGAEQITYLTTAARKGAIEENVLATGIVKPHRLVAVGARATGRIVSLKVAAGDTVKEGDLLAEIDPITQQNDLKNKEAALANNRARLAEQQAQLVLASQNLARKTTMLKNHAVSQADYDAAATEVKVREAQISALKAQITQSEVDVETARVNLGYTQVTAPFDGTVLATVVQEGQNVNAVQSAPTIVILGDLSKMTVRTQISEADIVQVKPGQDLWLNVIGNMDRRYDGRLETIEPAPESIRNDISFNSSAGTSSSANNAAIYYNGLFTIDNADGALRTYMTAEVHIVLGHAKDALLIPADSLGARDRQGLYMVRVLQDNGKIVEKKVKTGLNNKVMVQVLSGLEAGDKVITGERSGTGTLSNTGRRRGRVL